ncbi:MAG: nitroreductase family deazaflavin-dependent oxidoreductase [Acidobacteriaceae bacterium]|nr:nitroreductase family deazaflavin-dependent oxidoreductase [Acidobacteriaceae bacterium]
MPFPRLLARLNLHVTNRILGPLAAKLPGMGIVVHTGRRTHRQYRSPVMFFRRDNDFIFALTYGRESQWVQNVLAHGSCEFETQGHTLRLSNPRLFHDPRRTVVKPPHRLVLGLLNVSDFLELARSS